MTSSTLRIRSFAKINLALSVLGRRTDGYHQIQTIFQTIDLFDTIEVRPAPELELICEGLPDVRVEDNLVWKAASILKSTLAEDRGVSITLRKRIPAGAGLGGGSSNAAAALLALRRFWNAGISDGDLSRLGASLGSDVPFFLSGGTALGSGRGEIIRSIPDIHPEHLVVIFPAVHVSTAEAYRSLNLGLTSTSEDHRIHRFCGQLQEGTCRLTGIFNDFEASILTAYPSIREAKEFLIERGATAALLSGSGSSVFGFFPGEESASAAARGSFREAWRVFPAKTLSRAEYFQNMFG
ncbi:MAG TPA: 4-(cytidine 5'-diphospho)-2-C-methyl-D-erythritol kinase [Acidobacteriota bacterium]|nr:4-(cytidine 5'-diphospho)-2-C-methyl-D-erythritol kinase [Acidobacteriota bacterium]